MDFEEIAKTEDFKKWAVESNTVKEIMAPWKDSHVSQGINTFKERHPEIKPGETVKPENDKAGELALREAELKLRELAVSAAVKHGVDPALAIKLVGKDEYETKKNLGELFNQITTTFEAGRKQFVKENNYNPPLAPDQGPVLSYHRMVNETGYYTKMVKSYGRDYVEAFIQQNKHKSGGAII